MIANNLPRSLWRSTSRLPTRMRNLSPFAAFAVLALTLTASAASLHELANAQEIDLIRASSEGYVDFWVSGSRTSSSMSLRVKNRTERTWIVHIEVGYKLEPGSGDIQNMVVTKEVHVSVEPHDEEKVELEVACLDISKEAPSERDTKWTARRSSALAEFLRCTNRFVDEATRQNSSYEQLRQPLVQMALWKARGASRQQWIDFFVKYQKIPRGDAAKLADELSPALGELVGMCPRLSGV
jgi:hypothetical protein